MPNYDDRIKKQLDKLEQLKQQSKDQRAREHEQRQKLENRRKFVVGETIIKYFPETLPFSTEQTADEKKKLIALFDKYIAALATNHDLIQQQKIGTIPEVYKCTVPNSESTPTKVTQEKEV